MIYGLQCISCYLLLLLLLEPINFDLADFVCALGARVCVCVYEKENAFHKVTKMACWRARSREKEPTRFLLINSIHNTTHSWYRLEPCTFLLYINITVCIVVHLEWTAIEFMRLNLFLFWENRLFLVFRTKVEFCKKSWKNNTKKYPRIGSKSIQDKFCWLLNGIFLVFL